MKTATKRRGRPRNPRGPTGKTAVFGARLAPALRQRLTKSAEARGASLSAEVSSRLLASFKLDDERKSLLSEFGSPRTAALFLLLAKLARSVDIFSSQEEWLDDPSDYDHAVQGMNLLLEQFRPAGEVRAAEVGKPLARGLLAALVTAEGDDAMSRIKRDLGEAMLKRIKRP